MSNIYQIYLISDSTGETLDRIFTAIKAQFKNIDYKIHTYSFTRTENQILKILSNAQENQNSIILYSIVDSSLAKHLAKNSEEKNTSIKMHYKSNRYILFMVEFHKYCGLYIQHDYVSVFHSQYFSETSGQQIMDLDHIRTHLFY